MNTRNRNVLRTGLSILAGLTLAAAANAAPPVPAQIYDTDPVSPAASLADFNRSGAVTTQDFFDFMAAWYGKNKSADLDHSGEVTISDLWKFMNVYLSSLGTGKGA